MKEISDTDFRLIEDYIYGNLSSKDELNFKNRLATEDELRKAYNFRLKMAQLWKDEANYSATKDQVKQVLGEKTKSTKKLWMILYAAASVILIIGITIFYTQRQKAVTPGLILSDTENDTASGQLVPLSVNEQPLLGNKYQVLEYYQNDTLVVMRATGLTASERVHIIRLPDSTVVKKYMLNSGLDSLLIPLNDLLVGKYIWLILGTDKSKEFIIKE